MPRRNSMRRIRDCLRLYYENNLSQSHISRSLGTSRSTVQDYLSRLTIAGMTYADCKLLTDDELEEKLYRAVKVISLKTDKEMNFSYIHSELAKTGVTLRLLWEEYKRDNPKEHQYSQYCYHYQQWRKTLKVYMRQHHIAGERLFVDYSGKKPQIVNRFTGEINDVELFVICWGYSHYTYAEAQENQKISNWLAGHIRAFTFFDCVSKLIVPDNYKGAVTKANRYDPDINPSYNELAEHYGIGVLPARANSPKDKAKVENSVLIVQRWILARLRNQIFHSIDELNRAIWKLLEDLNNRKMQKLKKSRMELFLSVDKPNARPLPQTPHVIREWFVPSINIDYHIEVNKRFYSVPWYNYGKKIKACIENSVLSVFLNEKCIATHTVLEKEFQYSTNPEHMPPAHKAQYNWNAALINKKAREIGTNTLELINKIISQKTFPEQGYRPAMGIVRLAQTYGNTRLEAAAAIALKFGLIRTGQVADILKNGKDRPVDECIDTIENQNNVRGQNYYN